MGDPDSPPQREDTDKEEVAVSFLRCYDFSFFQGKLTEFLKKWLKGKKSGGVIPNSFKLFADCGSFEEAPRDHLH